MSAVALVVVWCLPVAGGSERELNTDEEEEAKFKTGGYGGGSVCVDEGVHKPPAIIGSYRLCAPLSTISNTARLTYEAAAAAAAVRTGVVQRPKDKILSMSPQEITYEMVGKKLVEIAMARGKTTRIDRQEQVRCVALQPAIKQCCTPECLE